MKDNFELNDEQLDTVSGGFLGGLFGYSEEPTPAAVVRGLSAGMEFDTHRSCLSCTGSRYRVKDFNKNDRQFRVVCCSCGTVGYWDYEVYDSWKA